MTQSSTMSRNFPTLRYLAAPFRWLFGSRRRVMTAVAVLLAMIIAPPLWWSIQLWGLPDVGAPFEEEAFRSIRIPDDRNAFVLYRQAARVLKPLASSRKPSEMPLRQRGPWPKDEMEGLRWVEENRQAMTVYRQGTERPDALDLELPTTPQSWEIIIALRSLHVLARLEGTRLEHQGDMAGAWGWYRAALRATYHMCLRGSVGMRMNAQVAHGELREQVTQWAADPRTTPAMIRQALDDAIACEAFTPSDSYTLKAEYPEIERMLDNPNNPGRYAPFLRLRRTLRLTAYLLTPEQLEAIADVWRWWRREPERSRRVLRLAFANWLAYEDLPPDRRPSPSPGISGPYDFYDLGPDAPAKARALSPAALDHWLASSSDAFELMRGWRIQALRVSERAGHRALVVLLASELYRRDHRGDNPPSDEALVGPYLKTLPDDGTGRDETAPSGGGAAPGVPGSTGQE
jgi:hypothetical protein